MESTVRQVSTHLVRQHRKVRGRLPELTGFANHVATGRASQRADAARGALRLLERDVLALADVEDAFVHGSVGGKPSDIDLERLRPEHDTLRIGTDQLQSFVENPTDDPVDVAGLLIGLEHLLRAHLDDEWHTLLPRLAHLSHERATPLLGMLPSGLTGPTGSSDLLHVPASFNRVQDRLAGSGLGHVGPRVAAAAEAAAQRAATHLAVPGSETLRATVDMIPVVSSPHVTLLVGRLGSTTIESVLAPVEFEVTITRGGSRATTLELRYDLVPRLRLPPGAPAHDVTAAAMGALAGELAFIGLGHDPVPPRLPASSARRPTATATPHTSRRARWDR